MQSLKGSCLRAALTALAVPAMLAVLAALAGCAAAALNSKALAPRFYGVWSNTDPQVQNWLEIDAHHAVSFGLQWDGRCAPTQIDVAARDRVIVPVSSMGSGPMSLALSGAVLVISGRYSTNRYVPTTRAQICQSGGTYLPGAPYPASGH